LGNIHLHYILLDELGRGSFSIVRRGECRHSGEIVAVKIINKNDVNALHIERLENELSILKKVDGCNQVISLLDAYEDSENIYLVFEMVEGGNLQDISIDTVPYPERDAAKILKSVLHAISFCHRQGVIHRDMKPDNILCNYDMTEIKLADFGLATFLGVDETTQGTVGTRAYLSPEMILKQPYDFSVDMWSIGCIAYILLGGYHPFSDKIEIPLYTQIVTGEWKFDDQEWKNASDTAKDFVSQLLVLDPSDRMTANEALRHPFIRTSFWKPPTLEPQLVI